MLSRDVEGAVPYGLVVKNVLIIFIFPRAKITILFEIAKNTFAHNKRDGSFIRRAASVIYLAYARRVILFGQFGVDKGNVARFRIR